MHVLKQECCFWDFIIGEILLLSCTQQTHCQPICVGILCLHLCSYLNLRLLLGEWLRNLTKKLILWAYSPLLVNTVKQLIAISKAHNSIAPELSTTQRFRDSCVTYSLTPSPSHGSFVHHSQLQLHRSIYTTGMQIFYLGCYDIP
jgi:hypothetical protein